MDKFQYTLKLEEMKRLTTKVAKSKFVKYNLPYIYTPQDIDYYNVSLMMDI